MDGRTEGWKDGRTEVKQHTPSPFGERGYNNDIDGKDLVFGYKLHIGTPYHGKRFLTRQIPTSCLSKSGGIKINMEIILF
jgi:hypothetical protein